MKIVAILKVPENRELYKGSDSARAQLGKFFADFISEMSEINA